MPELPEAETIARDLRKEVLGRRVIEIQVVHPDLLGQGLEPAGLRSALTGKEITGVGRRGKNLVLTFDESTILRINLGMTGRLIVSDSPRASEFRHLGVRFDLDDGRSLLYDDIRRFGRIDLHDEESWTEWEGSLGVEPLSDEFTDQLLYSLTQRSRSPIRNWLLDQRRIAGIGNIYAVEALWHAEIHPARPARSLTREEVSALRDALQLVLRESIEARGTTISDYRDSSGESGGYSAQLQVYGREGDPCPRCRTPVERIILSNRSAFFCPKCQRAT